MRSLLRRASLAAVFIGVLPAIAALSSTVSATNTVAASTQCSSSFFADNKVLGPARLPTSGEDGMELRGYHRTGSFAVRAFLSKYYLPAANGGSGGWLYPPDGGYVVGSQGQKEEARLDLFPGTDLDRYGSEYGAFLSPAGLPYAARSIPPQNLDSEPAPNCNYHEYRVEKEFAVDAGPIAPWFGQPGGGTQFQLIADLIPGGPTTLNVLWLIENGYLARLR